MTERDATIACRDAGFTIWRGPDSWWCIAPADLTGAAAQPSWFATLGDAVAGARRLERLEDFKLNGH